MSTTSSSGSRAPFWLLSARQKSGSKRSAARRLKSPRVTAVYVFGAASGCGACSGSAASCRLGHPLSTNSVSTILLFMEGFATTPAPYSPQGFVSVYSVTVSDSNAVVTLL